jgi:hypothetical protein
MVFCVQFCTDAAASAGANSLRKHADMVFIFVIAIAVLSVSLGFLLNGAWSAVFATGDVPEPPDNPRDLDDPEQRREFERRYPPTKRL